ncbi:MAG TPA: site-2 protease family protein [Syntrophales bacterium]|jgi:membrane-associated protease RseP (regulator of RpoE activity)|nr:site-2 protease family protein [Syntrophales bacterium]HON23950.1 site-2 protease family protein [Syntrophales bacterium]HOU77205.1 site-2 protease family protein [Syntrophales bacterium]HPC32030.1 site-2 protease family protein [Syntrophales bacterium]HQG33777.1 site-2 protease family protein [Syntrophales bacterium]
MSKTHLILFLLTLITTLVAGAIQQGVNLLNDPGGIWRGIPFSFTLIAILAAHEFGHYFMARRHEVDVTLPYFIPAPSFIGTFGAFIKMKSPLLDRRMLLDIGAAGPVAGLIAALPVIVVGFALSEVRPVTSEDGLSLGSSLLFSILGWIVHGSLPRGMDIVLHPIAFSGWIGLLVTCLNLLPVGQLDGGHVAYAVLGRRQRFLARVIFLILIVLGMTSWSGWLIWAVILYVMGLSHPPVVYEWVPLDRRRRIIGWASMGIFVLTFTPAPF